MSAGPRHWWVKQRCTNKTIGGSGCNFLNFELGFQVCKTSVLGMLEKQGDLDGDGFNGTMGAVGHGAAGRNFDSIAEKNKSQTMVFFYFEFAVMKTGRKALLIGEG